jgi:hypothetical protein
MPVLTFLRDAIDYAKGPYHRHIGRHTKTFCARAAGNSKTASQKRIWLATAISADEAMASIARLENRRPVGPLALWQTAPKAKPRHYLKALRIYLSALLVLYGTCKAELLEYMGLAEGEFMDQWKSIFRYDGTDQALFDETLVPAFRAKGLDGLVSVTGKLLHDVLFQQGSGPENEQDFQMDKGESAALQGLLVDDLAALKRNLERRD